MILLQQRLVPALKNLQKLLKTKSKAFHSILKIGRTHLQDATPIRLGQEFGGYARQVELAIHRIQNAGVALAELPLGGTAVGTGINTHPLFAKRTISLISRKAGYRFREATDHFEAQGARDALIETSGALKTAAASLIKIANDIRWMGSGPRCGLGEIRLPDTQPGSSSCPGR
jgi:fumarate hydratase class II